MAFVDPDHVKSTRIGAYLFGTSSDIYTSSISNILIKESTPQLNTNQA